MDYMKIHSTEEWRHHLDSLAHRVGLPNKQAVVNEAVKLLAEAAGMKPVDRLPDGSPSTPWVNARLDREKLNLAPLTKS